MAEPLPHPDSKPAIEGLCRARCDKNVAKKWIECARRNKRTVWAKKPSPIHIEERREVNALRKGEIGIYTQIRNDFLFVCNVGCVNAWIFVVLTEYTHTRKAWERVGRCS